MSSSCFVTELEPCSCQGPSWYKCLSVLPGVVGPPGVGTTLTGTLFLWHGNSKVSITRGPPLTLPTGDTLREGMGDESLAKKLKGTCPDLGLCLLPTAFVKATEELVFQYQVWKEGGGWTELGRAHASSSISRHLAHQDHKGMVPKDTLAKQSPTLTPPGHRAAAPKRCQLSISH